MCDVHYIVSYAYASHTISYCKSICISCHIVCICISYTSYRIVRVPISYHMVCIRISYYIVGQVYHIDHRHTYIVLYHIVGIHKLNHIRSYHTMTNRNSLSQCTWTIWQLPVHSWFNFAHCALQNNTLVQCIYTVLTVRLTNTTTSTSCRFFLQ